MKKLSRQVAERARGVGEEFARAARRVKSLASGRRGFAAAYLAGYRAGRASRDALDALNDKELAALLEKVRETYQYCQPETHAGRLWARVLGKIEKAARGRR